MDMKLAKNFKEDIVHIFNSLKNTYIDIGNPWVVRNNGGYLNGKIMNELCKW